MALLPPVAPAETLPPHEFVRAARRLCLTALGELAQRRLFGARVGVLGPGGLGSSVLSYPASAGVGTIGIVDDDVVDITNLQRQLIFDTADVDRPKSTVAAERIRSLSPHTSVIEHRERLTPENGARIPGGYDLVIDGSESFGTRYVVADACDELGALCGQLGGSIPGAVSVPLAQVLGSPTSVAVDGTVIAFCQEGPRARVAAPTLAPEHCGAETRLLDGGYADWSLRNRA